MKLRIVIALVVSTGATAPGQGNAIDFSQARAYFAEVRELNAADGRKMWGRSVAGPMMFVDPDSRTIIANQADAEGLLRSDGGLWTGKLPPEISPANTAQKFGGRVYSMIMWPVSDSRYSRNRLLMHESFHRIQDSLGLPAFSPASAHLVSAEGRIWTRLEWRALTEALLRSGDRRRQALSDALTFRSRRRSLSPTAAEDERKLELNEGLAEYTGLVLSGLPRSALYDRAAVQLAQTENQESFSRSFAYASGPAYGLLLDDVRKSWRKNLGASSDISEMARAAYRISPVNSANADKLVDRYMGARMVADERAREARRLAREADLRMKFSSGSRLTMPVRDAFSFSFNPNAVLPIQGLGTVYDGARVTDKWGILDAAEATVLFARDEKGLITKVVVLDPVAEGESVHGEKWKLTLSSGWTVTRGTGNELIVAERK